MAKHFVQNKFKSVVLLTVVLVFVGVLIRLIGHGTWFGGDTASASNLVGWGNDDSGQAGSGHLAYGAIQEDARTVKLDYTIHHVYGGLRHSLALTNGGNVYAWGDNTYGQMGNGKKGGSQVIPTKVDGLPKIIMLATKQDHTLALDSNGQVWAWGLNMSGQIGNGSNTDQLTPQPVKGMSDVTSIAAGYRSSIAVKRDGSVWAWGGNCNLKSRNDPSLLDYVTQLSVGGYTDTSGGTIDHITPEDDCLQEKYLNILSSVPIRVEGLPPIVTVAAGFGHMLAVTQDGDLWSWGCTLFGQVGNSINHNTDANLKPAKVAGISHVKEVAAGFRHSLVLTDSGEVWGWGHNYFGELGNGKQNDETIYPAPMRLSISNVKHIYAGHDYTLAIKNDDSLIGMGQGSFGQFGQMVDFRATPASILDMSHVETVAAGGAHVIIARKEAL